MLASDGTAVACGRNEDGECNVPALSGGVLYTQVATGDGHTVLLKVMVLPLLVDGITVASATSPSYQMVSSMSRLPQEGGTLFCSRAMAPLQLAVLSLSFKPWRKVSSTHTLPRGIVTQCC